ncbi:hypothetical protein [Limnofasciculus baicalensis]|uniref:Uncharacterized protein n=1 Tax=Limnofasciculus baicalensis BBK-W-15 TaxID=2699891 RepID=A0AAE3GQD8_9CYAN|nr:hypothetical protein [Limnofasciculus baicalensis]MCP2728816.1 hypothetical protein [Limnofasciculus baicalensis BBK-W-15]
MSSSTNTPYRSKLFNVVNRQSRRLMEKSERAIRNLKVAATWGAQILLYPAYLLVQATISAGRQLGGKAKSGFSKLNSSSQSKPSQPQTIIPPADTPIQEILKKITILPLPDVQTSFNKSQNLTPQPPALSGQGEEDFILSSPAQVEAEILLSSAKRRGVKQVIENGAIRPLKWTEIIISQSSLRGLKLLASGLNHWRSAALTQNININNLSTKPNNFWSPGFFSFIQADASITQTEDNGTLIPNSHKLTNNTPQTEADSKLISHSQKLTNNTIPNLGRQSWVIQGVATLLETRSLVLVTVENEILDILTPEQQQKLSARISWEIANLFRQWRIAGKSLLKKQPHRFSSVAGANLFLPVRMFWQLMGWVQTSPIAVTLNLFSESTLVTKINSPNLNLIKPLEPITAPLVNNPNLIKPLEPAPAPLVKSILAKIIPEKALLFLEPKGKGLDADTLAAESQSLVQELKNAILFRQQTQNPIQKLETQLITPQNSTSPTEKDNSHPFWLQDLIYRAIDYFFGRSSNLLETNSDKEGGVNQLAGIAYSSNIQSKLTASEIEPDPWLTWDDLFGKSDIADKNITPSQPTHSILKGDSAKNPPQLPERLNSKIAATGINSAWGLIHGYLKPKENITIIDNDTREETSELQQGLGGESSKNLPNIIGKLVISFREQFTVEAPGAIALNPNPLVSLSLGVSTDIPYPTKTPKPVKRRKNKQVAPTQNPIKVSETVSNLDRPIIPQTVTKTQNQQLITNKQKLTTTAKSTDIQPAPDWIETKAIRTGYVKHPLELILEWLDMAIVWVEELFLKVLEWVQKLWRSISNG